MPTTAPTLTELAVIAHTRRCTALTTADDSRVLLDDGPRPLPFLGVRFGPEIVAIAARVGVASSPSTPPVVAVDRSGDALVLDPLSGRTTAGDHASTTLDPARRALGLPTRPCRRPVWALLNNVWVDHMLAATLDAPLGDPPRWPVLSRLHPLHPGGSPWSPELLAHLTRCHPTDWEALRFDLITGAVPWAFTPPPLAAWFDAGSLARHCFASLPDIDVALADLHELLRPADAQRVEAGLAAP